jgi:prepilin-type N-terminal cleavage/methylation domain-containing protein
MKTMNDYRGFTLLEIVIVLTIIGFLLAMIAPRLGSIGTSAVQKIDESNIKDLSGFITEYQQLKNRLPNKLITIVNSKAGGQYQMPLIDDGDASNGPETIGYDFSDRCKLRLHVLNKEEADEIKKLGVLTVLVLNDYKGSTNTVNVKDKNSSSKSSSTSQLLPQTFASGDEGRPFNQAEVQEGLAVLMVGAGAGTAGSSIQSAVKEDDELGNPDLVYRIVFGVGKDSSLITEGIVQNEGLSPKGMQNSDYNTFNNYCLVLPRLKSSIKRIAGGEPKEIKVFDSTYSKDDEKAQQRVIDLSKAQELWETVVCSPLGTTWPQDSVSKWKIGQVSGVY